MTVRMEDVETPDYTTTFAPWGAPVQHVRAIVGAPVMIRRLNSAGEPVGDWQPLGVVGGGPGGEPGGEPDPVDLLWESWDGGVSDRLRGASAIRAVMFVTGRGIDDAAGALRVEMNRRLVEAQAKKRVYRSQVKKYSANVWNGVPREVLDSVLAEAGWVWVPVVSVGSGATLHVRWSELPEEALVDAAVLRLSSDEYVAVEQGVVKHPTDPSRNGLRTVYGYYAQARVREVFAPAGAYA